MILYNFNSYLIAVKIISRPSKISKTPYVADILLNDNTITQAHCPSLGCCGLCEKDKIVYVYKLNNKSKKNICKYKVYCAYYSEFKRINNIIVQKNILVGIEPKIAEFFVELALNKNLIKKLRNIKSYKREVKFMNSRFDFYGIDENEKEFIIEVKNVPLADYEDIPNKIRKTRKYIDNEYDNKIAYFPDGYRKNNDKLVSERALKHINELSNIKRNENIRTIICYVIQRKDVSSFQISNLDPIYKNAVQEALYNNVELLTLVVEWNYNGKIEFIKENIKYNV